MVTITTSPHNPNKFKTSSHQGSSPLTRKLNNPTTYQVGIIDEQAILRISRDQGNSILCVDIAIPSEATAEDITRLLAKTDPRKSLMNDDFISKMRLKQADETQIFQGKSLFETFCFGSESEKRDILKQLRQEEGQTIQGMLCAFLTSAGKPRSSY